MYSIQQKIYRFKASFLLNYDGYSVKSQTILRQTILLKILVHNECLYLVSLSCLYTVNLSETSQTILKIRTIHKIKGPIQTPKDVQNPYIFKPKSYSKKRAHESPSKKQEEFASIKKTKEPSKKKKEFNLDFSKLKSAVMEIKKVEENFQQSQFFNSFLSQKKYPSLSLELAQNKRNQLLKRQVQIVSNTNQKISIPIHQGLYKCNTSHKNLSDQSQGFILPNRFDIQGKNQYSNSIPFIREYKSGYAPIDMQNRNKDLQQAQIKDQTNKVHFIRKKQSTLNLPRTCGVSYIKPSQSVDTQKPPFLPLPPLIFQGSTSCQISSNVQDIQQIQKIQQIVKKFLSTTDTCCLPFIMSNQQQMRNLLLNIYSPTYKMGFVQGIQNLWPLFSEGLFILILFTTQQVTSQKQIWNLLQYNKTYFKIGILVKKSTSGKRSFLKSIKIESQETLSQVSFQKTQEHQAQQNSEQKKIDKPQSSCKIKIDCEQSPKEQKKVESSQIQIQKKDIDKQAQMMQYLQTQLKDSRTVITLSLRMEMYVEADDWKQKFGKVQKKLLNQMILALKQKLQKTSISIIKERFQLSKQSDRQSRIVPFLSKIRIFNQSEQKQISLIQDNVVQNLKVHQIYEKQHFKIEKVQKIINFYESLANDQSLKNNILKKTSIIKFEQIPKIKSESWQKSLKMPIYYISTRDSFAFDLIEKKTLLKRQNGRQYQRIDYYFYPDNVPTNYGNEYRKLFPNFQVGVTSYHGFFSEQQLKEYETKTFQTQNNAFKNKFLQMTVQPSIVGTKIKRTKFFFGYRYMWTRCQLAEPTSYVGAGVRKDVTPTSSWTKNIEKEMVKEGIVEKDFLNSIAINVYHDGRQGLAQHFDDAVRFKQPIFTLRLFSDARLSFGSQFYGFCNGAFIIPLPRGCICVMQQNSYAANGVKHCVRPCDMTGKSAAVILRQMHEQVVSQASKYDELIDFPAWVSCLSEDENAITFAQQKRIEAQQLMD